MIIKITICILLLFLILICLNKTKKEDFNIICSNFQCTNNDCSVITQSRHCNDRNIVLNNKPNCYFDKIVNPNDEKCVDFCINTYTYPKDSVNPINGSSREYQFINNHESFFASKCDKCILNHENRFNRLQNN